MGVRQIGLNQLYESRAKIKGYKSWATCVTSCLSIIICYHQAGDSGPLGQRKQRC